MRRGCAAEVGAQGINLLAKNAFGGVLGGTAPHQTIPRAVPEGHAQFRHPCHFYQCHLIFKLRSVFLILPYVVFSALYASCISFRVSSRVLSSYVLPRKQSKLYLARIYEVKRMKVKLKKTTLAKIHEN